MPPKKSSCKLDRKGHFYLTFKLSLGHTYFLLKMIALIWKDNKASLSSVIKLSKKGNLDYFKSVVDTSITIVEST